MTFKIANLAGKLNISVNDFTRESVHDVVLNHVIGLRNNSDTFCLSLPNINVLASHPGMIVKLV